MSCCMVLSSLHHAASMPQCMRALCWMRYEVVFANTFLWISSVFVAVAVVIVAVVVVVVVVVAAVAAAVAAAVVVVIAAVVVVVVIVAYEQLTSAA